MPLDTVWVDPGCAFSQTRSYLMILTAKVSSLYALSSQVQSTSWKWPQLCSHTPEGFVFISGAMHLKPVQALHEAQKTLGLGFCGRQDPNSASAVTENLWIEMENFPPLRLTCTVFILCLQVYSMFSYTQEHPSTLTDSYSDYCSIHKSPEIIRSPQTTLPPETRSPFMYDTYTYAVSQPDVYELLKVNLISRKPEISELSPFVSQVSAG